jgi:hypothetical protein
MMEAVIWAELECPIRTMGFHTCVYASARDVLYYGLFGQLELRNTENMDQPNTRSQDITSQNTRACLKKGEDGNTCDTKQF